MKPYQAMEARYPHAPDVLEREVAEQGFAAGWCLQGKPVPAYYFDCHVHLGNLGAQGIADALAPDAAVARTMDVRRALLILRLGAETADAAPEDAAMAGRDASYSLNELGRLIAGLPDPDLLVPALWWPYRAPHAEQVAQAAQMGVRCIKLHNAPVICQAAPPDLWLSPGWTDAFAAMARHGLPVLWHVTQRLPSNAYTGGGRNTYWREGWANGAQYGNEELLQSFLTCCARNPSVPFIGAHQLHVGWERLDRLFAGYPNLYVDTTVGCVLRPEDTFYPHDKAFLRDVFIQWADRLLFGTDVFWPDGDGAEVRATTAMHQRFLAHLDLPDDVLQKVCHGNAERLLGLAPLTK